MLPQRVGVVDAIDADHVAELSGGAGLDPGDGVLEDAGGGGLDPERFRPGQVGVDRQ